MEKRDVREVVFQGTAPAAPPPAKEKSRGELVSDYDEELRKANMPRGARRQLVREFNKELGKRGVR